MTLTTILLWIVLGGIAGWIASAITGSKGSTFRDIILGILGAVIGGWIMNLLGQSGTTGFNLWSLLVSVLGAIVLIWIVRAFRK